MYTINYCVMIIKRDGIFNTKNQTTKVGSYYVGHIPYCQQLQRRFQFL